MAAPPEQLRIRLLGGLAVEGIESHDLGSRKARVLVAALAAAAGRAVPPAVLEEVVWSEGPPARPVEQLQVLVSRLRRVLGADRIVRTDGGYRLVPDWLDLVELTDRVREAEARVEIGAWRPARAAAEAAVALARGPLVPEVDAPWFDEIRGSTERTVARAHRLLAEAALAADPVGAALAAEAVLDRDGYDETALRLLMRAHASAGRPASALAAYARVRERLAEDLGVDPTPETEALHTSILMGTASPPSVASPPEPASAPGRPALVGRGPELAALLEALDRAAVGPATGVVVEGEAGIGKTALVEAFATEGRRRGAVVLTARCDPLARDLPLQPLLEAVEEHARRLGPLDASVWLGAEAERLHPLLELTGGEPGRGAATSVDDGPALRAALFRDLLAVVGRLASELPAVLVVEDLHLADAATMELVDLVLRRGSRILVVASRRPSAHALVGPDIAIEQRLVLGPLDLDDARDLIGESAGDLLGRSGGNPLFLLQLSGAHPGELPRSIVEAVQRRVASLGDAASALTAMAALGPEVDLDLLGGVLELPVGELLDHLDAAVVAGFLADDGSQLRFAHEVVREALSATLASVRRAHLHRAAASALAGRPGVDPTTVAWHARLGGDDDLAATALVRAARMASARFEGAEAERLLGEAIDLRDSVEARLLRARARIGSWDLEAAAVDVDRAIALGGGPAAMETAGWVAYYRRDYDEAQRCAEEGAARAADPEVRASCLALAGRCRHTMGGVAAASSALEEAVGSGSVSSRPIAQIWLAGVRNHQGQPASGLELAASGLIDPNAVGHPFGIAHGHFAEALSLGMLGRPLDALARADALVEAVEGTGHKMRFRGMAANCRGWVLRWLGAFDEADEWNRQAAASPIRPETAEFHYVGVLDLVEGRLLVGDHEGAAELLDTVAELETFAGSMAWRMRDRVHLYRARNPLAAGDLVLAHRTASQLAEEAASRGSRRHELFARSVVAAASAGLGREVDRLGVEADVDALAAVAGLEAWWYTALVANALDADDLRRRAAAAAAHLAAAAGPLGARLVTWSTEVLKAR